MEFIKFVLDAANKRDFSVYIYGVVIIFAVEGVFLNRTCERARGRAFNSWSVARAQEESNLLGIHSGVLKRDAYDCVSYKFQYNF